MAVTGPDWSALNRLLDSALQLPPDERASWVESLQGDDARLRPMLLELLSKQVPELPTLPPLGEGDARLQEAGDETRPPASARVGDVLLGRFRLSKIIGRGGMGVVFAANDLQMQGEPQIAVKLLNEAMRANPIADIALQRECRKVRMLANDAIVRMFEFYRSDDQAFITMELLEGESLDMVLRRNPDGMSFDEAWRIIRPVTDALSYAHRQKPPFVHSDLKPPNVFLTKSGQVKVLDFGVARAVRATDGTVSGLTLFDPAKYGALTPAYASCEMLAGLSADPSDDVYALACVTYELLSGRHPYARTPADKARAKKLAPKPIGRLSAPQNAALVHGLALERSERTASVEQFVTELEQAGRPAERRVRRVAVVSAAAACGVALLVALGSYWLWAHKAPLAATTPGALIAGGRALALLQTLGVTAPQVKPDGRYSRADLGRIIESSPRHVTLGSTPEQIDAALALCRHYSSSCEPGWYEDEGLRQAVLTPFAIDAAPVTVREFRDFVAATHYQTEAERSGVAYAVVDGNLQAVAGGSWRNAVNLKLAADAAAVVGVSFADATEYCRFRGERLPTEDEWEYITRGPERHTFGWGEDGAPANIAYNAPPAAASGPAQGIGARYRGLSANVWQWVDTEVTGRKVLKGGSWLETNPANKRAATRRYELPRRADADSGFRCARSLAAWPDAQLWLAQLR